MFNELIPVTDAAFEKTVLKSKISLSDGCPSFGQAC